MNGVTNNLLGIFYSPLCHLVQILVVQNRKDNSMFTAPNARTCVLPCQESLPAKKGLFAARDGKSSES